MKIIWIALLAFVMAAFPARAATPANYTGIAVFVNEDADSNIPQYALWNGTNFSPSRPTGITFGRALWVHVETNPAGYEAVMGGQDGNGTIIFAVYNALTDTWGNQVNASSVGINGAGSTQDRKRMFDIAYEHLSGRALAIFTNGSYSDLDINLIPNASAAYKIWNGSAWNSTAFLPDDECAGWPSWIRAEGRPNSNQIVEVDYNRSSQDICAQVWDGSAWGNSQLLTQATSSPGVNTRRLIDLAVENLSSRVMVAWTENALATANTRIWDGSAWLGNITIPTGDLTLSSIINWVTLGNDYDSNRLVYAQIDGTSDLDIWHWNSTNWGVGSEPDTSIEILNTKDVAPGFAGRNGTVLYGSGDPGDTDFAYARCNNESDCQQGTWNNFTNVSGCNGNIRWLNLWQDPFNTNQSMATTITDASSNNLCIRHFNNTAWNWSSTNVLGSGNFSFERLSFAYFEFVPGILNISLRNPALNSSSTQTANTTFYVNASVQCSGILQAVCGIVNGTLRRNSSDSPSQVPNSTGSPFHTLTGNNISCGLLRNGQTCDLSWLVNASGPPGTNWTLDVNFTSSSTYVYSNDTGDFQVNITQIGDLSFSIGFPSLNCTLGNGSLDASEECELCAFRATDLSAETIQNRTNCEGQNVSVGFYKFTNTGNVNLNWTMALNQSLDTSKIRHKISINDTGYGAGCTAQENPPPKNTTCALVESTSAIVIQQNLAPGSTQMAWAWADFTGAYPSDDASRNITHTSIQS